MVLLEDTEGDNRQEEEDMEVTMDYRDDRMDQMEEVTDLDPRPIVDDLK